MDWNLGTAARTLWQEARGEPLIGQQAVAHVLVNRLHLGRWGDTLGSVCLWHAQFSAWGNPSDPNFEPSCGLHDDDAMLVGLAALIQAALDGALDPTGGATFYHAKGVTPYWAKPPAIFCGQFGSQLFWKNVP